MRQPSRSIRMRVLAARQRAAIDDRDREIIDAHADELAAEALDVLRYQIET